MNSFWNLFHDELINWMIDKSGFYQPKYQMYVYYKYAPYGSKLFMLYYVDDCVYWYTYEEIGNWFVDTLGKILHVNFLGYANWFISIRISQLKYHYISVYQARYATPVFVK